MDTPVVQSGNMELFWWVMVMDTTETNPHPAFYSGHHAELEAMQLASEMQQKADQLKKETEEWNAREKEAKEAMGMVPKLETVHNQQYSVVNRVQMVTACLAAMPRTQLVEIYKLHHKAPERKPSILQKLPMGATISLEVVERAEAEEKAHDEAVAAYEKSIQEMSDDAIRKILLNTPANKMHPGYCIQRPNIQ